MDGQNLFSFFGRPSITFTTLSSSSPPPSFIHLFIHPLTLILQTRDRKKYSQAKKGQTKIFVKRQDHTYRTGQVGKQVKILVPLWEKNVCQVCRLRCVCTFIKSNEVFRKAKSIRGKKLLCLCKKGSYPKNLDPVFSLDTLLLLLTMYAIYIHVIIFSPVFIF